MIVGLPEHIHGSYFIFLPMHVFSFDSAGPNCFDLLKAILQLLSNCLMH